MSLYIGGAITKHAIFDDGSVKIFEKMKKELDILANKYDIFIDSLSVTDQSDYAFVISNKNLDDFKCFYGGGCFEYDMNIKSDMFFEKKANKFIEEINTINKLKSFHHLDWSSVAPRYYVVS